uniref:Putative tick transposon n=1 Tax=Ixodes ricinus TaxID=34613 RepID=A0A147BN60_IXORI
MRAVTGVPDEDSDECVDGSEEPNVCESAVPTSAQALDAPDLLRRFFGAHDDGEDELEIAAAAEKVIIRLKKTRQTMDFFAVKHSPM